MKINIVKILKTVVKVADYVVKIADIIGIKIETDDVKNTEILTKQNLNESLDNMVNDIQLAKKIKRYESITELIRDINDK